MTGIGADGVTAMLKALHEQQEELSSHARSALQGLAAQMRALASEIDGLAAQILAWLRADETSRRLATILGIGPITASAISAAVPESADGAVGLSRRALDPRSRAYRRSRARRKATREPALRQLS